LRRSWSAYGLLYDIEFSKTATREEVGLDSGMLKVEEEDEGDKYG